jgi:hypothetical protein
MASSTARYGPGTPFEEGGQFPAMVRRRLFPIVGDGAGVWSFILIDDAASATVVGRIALFVLSRDS